MTLVDGLRFPVVVALPVAEDHGLYTGTNATESIGLMVGHACAPVRGLQLRGSPVEQTLL